MSKNLGQSSNRALVRDNKKSRTFNNKKGIQLVVTRYGNRFFKTQKRLQYLNNKTIVHHIVS